MLHILVVRDGPEIIPSRSAVPMKSDAISTRGLRFLDMHLLVPNALPLCVSIKQQYTESKIPDSLKTRIITKSSYSNFSPA